MTSYRRPVRLHYAWVMAAVTFAILSAAGGVRGSSGLLIVPLETEFHWPRGVISFAIGVNLCLYGIVGPFAAALMESFGLRRTILTAIAVISTGLLLTPLMDQAWELVTIWGLLVGSGTGVIANVFAVTVATQWFAAKRGLIIGILTSAAAGGQLLFLPVLANINASYGWRAMSVGIAVVTLILLPVAMLLLRDRPSDLGLVPYGEIQNPSRPVCLPAKQNPLRVAFDALFIASKSRDFWLVAGSIFICGASTQGLIGTHLIPACLDHGIPEVTAASMLAGMALLNVVGATASGWLSDRIDPRILLFTYYGLRGISLVYLPFAFDTLFGLTTFSVFYGLDWIATIPATIRLTADRFGAERTGIIFGWVMAIHQIGGALAAFLAGALRMDLGTYLQAFMISGLLCFIAAFMSVFIRRQALRDANLAFSR